MEHPAKADLRARTRRLLAALPAEARAAASAHICRRIAALPQWASARTVALYAAQPSEPDLSALLDAPGKAFCFPRVSGAELEFHRCQARALLLPGPWDLLEPDPLRCPLIPPPAIDLLCIPGLAFTAGGGRLGRGGGYYDRYLARVRPTAVKLGIGFHAQLLPSIPVEIHDIAMDHIITDTGAYPRLP